MLDNIVHATCFLLAVMTWMGALGHLYARLGRSIQNPVKCSFYVNGHWWVFIKARPIMVPSAIALRAVI